MLLYHLIPSQMLPTIGYKPRIAHFWQWGLIRQNVTWNKQRIFGNVLGYSSLLIWNLQNKINIRHWNIELAMVLLVICLLSFALVIHGKHQLMWCGLWHLAHLENIPDDVICDPGAPTINPGKPLQTHEPQLHYQDGTLVTYPANYS